MAGSTQQQQVMTTGQLAAMTPAQQQTYLNSLDAQTAASQAAALQQYKAQSNASYLALCAEKIATCFPASGGITANYTPGQTLIFNFPTASGGFAKDLLITLNINLTPAVGTGATRLERRQHLCAFQRVPDFVQWHAGSLAPLSLEGA